MPAAIERCAEYLRDGQLIVLRSTVHPGVTASPRSSSSGSGVKADVAFCPERIAEGKAMTELFELPQIVAARNPAAAERAEKLFRNLADQIVRLEPEEAELAKLFTNTWRYIKFAAANQFWMMSNDFGLDFERIRHADPLRVPARGRHAGRRVRGRAVPAQGHDAAGGVQQQHLRRSATAPC